MGARLWHSLENGAVQCDACAHACRIQPGRSGKCGVRQNQGGRLQSLVENTITGVQLDPLEKKPLFHFLPGAQTLSIGSAGCNFRCKFCQNHHISQIRGSFPGQQVNGASLVQLAIEHDSPALSYTYNEPGVFIELVQDCAELAHAAGLKNILVSNGFMSSTSLDSLAGLIDAANIDLKSFSEAFYRDYCGGSLRPVLENLRKLQKMGCWLEVTTLLIPQVNDSEQEILSIANFIVHELGPDVPWHVTGFHGAWQMAAHPSTSREKLEQAWQLGREAGLHHVYTGNIASSAGQDTICPECGETVIRRSGYRIRDFSHQGQCPGCGRQISGVWA